MGINDKTREALANRRPSAGQPQDAIALLATSAMKKQFAMALPRHLQENAERYIRSFMTQMRQVPKLMECNTASLLGAMMTATALGLDPTPALGHFYMIPYGREAQLQLGYKGLLELAYRGGVKKIWAHEVCENDTFELEWGEHEHLTHKPKMDGDRGTVTGYYAVAILPNGETSFKYMSKAEVEKHGRRFSNSFGRGPWATDFDAMAKKTVAKQLLQWLPKSTELSVALNKDEAVINANAAQTVENKEDIYNLPTEPIEVVVERSEGVTESLADIADSLPEPNQEVVCEQ